MSVENLTIKIEPEDPSYDSENPIPINYAGTPVNSHEPEFVNIKAEPTTQYIDIKIEPISDYGENLNQPTNYVQVPPYIGPPYIVPQYIGPPYIGPPLGPYLQDSLVQQQTHGKQNLEIELSIKQESSENNHGNSEQGGTMRYMEMPGKSNDIIINEVSDEILDLNSTIDGKYMCPICQKRFANKGNVRRHILLHNKEHFQCSTCMKKFTKQAHYDKHVLSHSNEKTYKCETCEKLFRTSSNLEQHRKIHLTVKPYQCQKCSRQFAVKANLLKHVGGRQCKIKSKEPLQCHVCHKMFHREFLLRSHLRRHTTEKPFSCELCKMNFKYKSTLIRHMQLHNGIKPFACKICRKTFTHAGLIKPHMRKHTGEKPYECSICHRHFAHKHNMQRHEQRHEKVKHLVCDICDKVFPKESRLKYHMRIHTKAKPFICHVCSKAFSHKQNIIRHYNRKHPTEKYNGQVTDASFAKDIWENVVRRKLEVNMEEEIII